MTDRDIFMAALDLEGKSERDAYLDAVCASDPAQRQRVEILLNSHDSAGSFLGIPALPSAPAPDETIDRDPLHDRRESESADDADEAPNLSFLSPSNRPDSLGRIGHYEMLQILGKGAFGIVFRAFDDTLQRVVAVKVLSPQIAITSPARKRFLREARASASVRHENVVQIYEVGEQPLPYLVMEFIPGETLQDRLNRTGPLEVTEVLRIGRQVAEGLAAAHANDLIHRDIKPGNVLIENGPQHRAKLTDFGLARAADDASISQSGIIAGTPMYMAPEQACGNKLDQRADLFSFGSVLYQMVSGRPPFRANNTLAVLKRVVEESPRPIREIIPEAPVWLCELIAKLHAKKPDDRFQSVREVADLLAEYEFQWKSNSKIHTLPSITQRENRKKLRMALGGVFAVVAVALLVMLWNPWGEPKDDAVNADAGTGSSPGRAVWQQWPADAPKPAIAPFTSQQARQHQREWANYLGMPIDFTNSIGMKFMLIPPGEFLMGTPDAERSKALTQSGGDSRWELCIQSEGPQRRVILNQPFYMCIHEITQGQYGRVMETNPAHFTPIGFGKDRVIGINTSMLPVEQVKWFDAVDFCVKLSQREQLKPGYRSIDTNWVLTNQPSYRLPTEAEWEYACRAGTVTRFWSGDQDADLSSTGWHLANAEGRTQQAGRSKMNPFGLFDMSGNVWEWTQDWWHTTYPSDAADQPGVNPTGPQVGTLRVVRGGSWTNPASSCRSGHRYCFEPNRWGSMLGFRVMLPVEAVRQLSTKSTNNPVEVSNTVVSPPNASVSRSISETEIQRIASLPTEQKIAEVRRELKRLNPEMNPDFQLQYVDPHGFLIYIEDNQLRDITPLRALRKIYRMALHSKVLTDISPLKGMTISEFDLANCAIVDFRPFREMSIRQLDLTNAALDDLRQIQDITTLKELSIAYTMVNDLTPIRNLKLTMLNIHATPVMDLTPIRDMALEEFVYLQVPVTDVGVLKGMPLRKVQCDFDAKRDGEILRGIQSLEFINQQPAQDFWKKVDSQP